MRLRDNAWADGGQLLFPLDILPPGKRVRKILLFFDLSGTKGETDAADSDELPQLCSLIRLGNYVNIPGWSLWELNKQIKGRIPYAPTAIPGSGTTFSMCVGS